MVDFNHRLICHMISCCIPFAFSFIGGWSRHFDPKIRYFILNNWMFLRICFLPPKDKCVTISQYFSTLYTISSLTFFSTYSWMHLQITFIASRFLLAHDHLFCITHSFETSLFLFASMANMHSIESENTLHFIDKCASRGKTITLKCWN